MGKTITIEEGGIYLDTEYIPETRISRVRVGVFSVLEGLSDPAVDELLKEVTFLSKNLCYGNVSMSQVKWPDSHLPPLASTVDKYEYRAEINRIKVRDER